MTDLKTRFTYGKLLAEDLISLKGTVPMIRRVLCLLIAVLLAAAAFPAASEEAAGRYSYDFDLAFSLNAQSFPPLLRNRASGYATLVNRLGLRGHIAWDTRTDSMDLSAAVYFRDQPSLSYPFRLYGVPERLFLTSPIIRNETILLNMAALMEFAVKTKNTLNVPLPYLAFLYPYSTEFAFAGLTEAWNETIGSPKKTGSISARQVASFSARAEELLRTDAHLGRWIQALANGSDAREAIETVFSELPSYGQTVTGGRKVNVTVGKETVTWKNAAGGTLFSRQEKDGTLSLALSLPPEENGYFPSLSFVRKETDQTLSFELLASFLRDENTRPAQDRTAETEAAEEETDPEFADPEEDSWEEDYPVTWEEEAYSEEEEVYGEEEEEEDSAGEWPDLLFSFLAEGFNLPAAFPADSDFLLNLTTAGAAYPNYTFVFQGTTKNDGSLSVSLCKPFRENAEPVVILNCTGTATPAEPEELPDYLHYDYSGTYNVFSFNEVRLADFRNLVLPSLIRGVFSFVEAAPTSACQSFLDDLTDMGFLDLLLN